MHTTTRSHRTLLRFSTWGIMAWGLEAGSGGDFLATSLGFQAQLPAQLGSRWSSLGGSGKIRLSTVYRLKLTHSEKEVQFDWELKSKNSGAQIKNSSLAALRNLRKWAQRVRRYHACISHCPWVLRELHFRPTCCHHICQTAKRNWVHAKI